VVRQIVESHGGTILFAADLPTRVTVTFPIERLP
jgi:signal transduction histidine kinase